MKKALIDILREIAVAEGIISSYSETIPSDKKTELIKAVNDAKEDVCEQVKPYSLVVPVWLKTEAKYSTGTAAITNGATIVTGTGTTFTSGMVGRKIKIGSDSSVYEVARFNTTASIEINRPFIGDTETAGAISILADTYELDPEVWRLIAFHDDENGVSIYERPATILQQYYPDPFDYEGDTHLYAKQGAELKQETVTASAATTTTVTLTAPVGTYDDQYKGWMLYNETQGQTVRVKGYVRGTGVITLDEAITDQAASDTMYLRATVQKIVVRDVQTDEVYWRGAGLKSPTPLVNDDDIEHEIPDDFASRILKVGARYIYQRDHGLKTVSFMNRDFIELKNELEAREGWQPNRTYAWGQNRRRRIDNPFRGGGWPAYQG